MFVQVGEREAEERGGEDEESVLRVQTQSGGLTGESGGLTGESGGHALTDVDQFSD